MGSIARSWERVSRWSPLFFFFFPFSFLLFFFFCFLILFPFISLLLLVHGFWFSQLF
jgi:hypothetical protein